MRNSVDREKMSMDDVVVLIVSGIILIGIVWFEIWGSRRMAAEAVPVAAVCDTVAADPWEVCQIDTLWLLASAIGEVESGYDDAAYNEKEDAAGWLQIRPIMVAEANRLLGYEVFNAADRYDAEMSYLIFTVVMEAHNPGLDIDKAIEVWNPNADAVYRSLVKNVYEELLIEEGGEVCE